MLAESIHEIVNIVVRYILTSGTAKSKEVCLHILIDNTNRLLKRLDQFVFPLVV